MRPCWPSSIAWSLAVGQHNLVAAGALGEPGGSASGQVTDHRHRRSPARAFPSIGRLPPPFAWAQHPRPVARLLRSTPVARPWRFETGPATVDRSDAGRARKPYPFLTEGTGVHRISVGPVRAGIIGPDFLFRQQRAWCAWRSGSDTCTRHQSLWVGADITRGAQLRHACPATARWHRWHSRAVERTAVSWFRTRSVAARACDSTDRQSPGRHQRDLQRRCVR
jgi:hypothetical protein